MHNLATCFHALFKFDMVKKFRKSLNADVICQFVFEQMLVSKLDIILGFFRKMQLFQSWMNYYDIRIKYNMRQFYIWRAYINWSSWTCVRFKFVK